MADRPLALIVGANRGIGLGVVKEFLARGWDVIATARRPASASDLQALARENQGRVDIRALEMTDTGGIDRFADGLAGRTLDVVLVNAGIAGPNHKSASAATVEETGVLMFTNAIAPIRLARHLLKNIKANIGVLGFTSSIMGSVALNAGGHELYRASKAALNSLTRGLYSEMKGRKLTLLTLHPGWVRTDMGGAGAPVGVDESARGLVDMLIKAKASHRNAFIDFQGQEIAW